MMAKKIRIIDRYRFRAIKLSDANKIMPPNPKTVENDRTYGSTWDERNNRFVFPEIRIPYVNESAALDMVFTKESYSDSDGTMMYKLQNHPRAHDTQRLLVHFYLAAKSELDAVMNADTWTPDNDIESFKWMRKIISAILNSLSYRENSVLIFTTALCKIETLVVLARLALIICKIELHLINEEEIPEVANRLRRPLIDASCDLRAKLRAISVQARIDNYDPSTVFPKNIDNLRSQRTTQDQRKASPTATRKSTSTERRQSCRTACKSMEKSFDELCEKRYQNSQLAKSSSPEKLESSMLVNYIKPIELPGKKRKNQSPDKNNSSIVIKFDSHISLDDAHDFFDRLSESSKQVCDKLKMFKQLPDDLTIKNAGCDILVFSSTPKHKESFVDGTHKKSKPTPTKKEKAGLGSARGPAAAHNTSDTTFAANGTSVQPFPGHHGNNASINNSTTNVFSNVRINKCTECECICAPKYAANCNMCKGLLHVNCAVVCDGCKKLSHKSCSTAFVGESTVYACNTCNDNDYVPKGRCMLGDDCCSENAFLQLRICNTCGINAHELNCSTTIRTSTNVETIVCINCAQSCPR